LIFRKRAQCAEVVEPPAYHDPLIQMREVVKAYKTPTGDFQALREIDADFYRGEFVGVIGKSGSGKSTLINMITGIDRPTTGTVQVAGIDIHRLGESQMARWRGRNLGIVFQFFQLLPMLSLLENVLLPMDMAQVYPEAEREQRGLDLLQRVGLLHEADSMPSEVSGGQQQSAAIARALANDPPIIVADEPTGNLDSKSAETIFHLFEDLVAQGKTIVMVTHDTELARRASRTVLLADGEIVNEMIATSLPLLTNTQMLQATHHLESLTFAPGQMIVEEGGASDQFHMIQKGQVQVLLHRANGREMPLATLSAGQYFGVMEMIQPGRAEATIRALGDEPVQTLALDRAVFEALLADAHATRDALAREAERRRAQTAAIRARLERPRRGGRHAQTSLA